jgi:endogenous inhibitor of DNA gyrase (YacG/DUF329 family)
MKTRLKFRCPECDARLSARDDRAGQVADCPSCQTNVTIPTSRALVPFPRQVTPELVEDGPPPALARRVRRRSEDVPVEMRLPGQLGGMKATVDRKTGNMMATTFLGGLMVAIGAVLFAMFGGKGRSA